MPSKASLRNDGNNPFLYLEDTGGSTCFGVNDATNRVNLITSNAVTNLEPSSGSAVFSVDQTANGNVEFAPHGTGDTRFLNGDVDIVAGNALLPNTTAAGASGVIQYGGNRFVHNYGTSNTFVGQTAGNFSLTPANSRFNTGVGYLSLNGVSGLGGESNTAVGSESCGIMTSGNENTALGRTALNTLLTGSNNTALGFGALSNSNSSGSNNTAIGSSAGVSLTGTDSNNIIIGQGVTGTIGDNRKIRIGQTSGGTAALECHIGGISGVSVTPAGTVVISSTGQLGSVAAVPMAWVDTTAATQQMAVNTGYVSNRNATMVTFTLPATAAIGDSVQVLGKGSALWLIAQNASQVIHFGSVNSTSGTGGSLASILQYDCVRLRCITANTDWVVTGETQGNLTIT